MSVKAEFLNMLYVLSGQSSLSFTMIVEYCKQKKNVKEIYSKIGILLFCWSNFLPDF